MKEQLCGLIHDVSYSAFLTAFWPNLIATIIGVFLGVFGALWLNNRESRNASRRKIVEDRHRLQASLSILGRSVDRNYPYLQALRMQSDMNAVTLVPGLEVSTWNAVQADIMELLSDPTLRGDLARYFEWMSRINRLNDMYVDIRYRTAPTHDGLLSVTIEALTENAKKALVETERLSAQLRSLISNAQYAA